MGSAGKSWQAVGLSKCSGAGAPAGSRRSRQTLEDEIPSMSYAERSITRSWSVSEMGVVGRSSSRRRLVEMSMQFTSALLVNGGDGIGVSDSSMG